jgi:hypothetical protein
MEGRKRDIAIELLESGFLFRMKEDWTYLLSTEELRV